MPSRAVMREQLNRLREYMPEDEIFMLDMFGRPCLSPKAARRLALLAVEDAKTWWEENRPAAERAAADILNQINGEAA